MLTWAAWGLLLLGVCAVPADPPGSISISVPGEEGFVLAWVPGAANDCSFQEWLVQLRSRNLNGTLVGSWRTVSCEEVPPRSSPECNVTSLQPNSPYDVQIFELCTDSAADSAAGTPEQVLWTLPGYWDIHIPPNSGSSYVVEDTMEDHAGCEVVKTCCDDQFSLCFSGNASRTVEVQRVDSEIGWPQQVGWGQDLYLRCYAPSVASFAPSTVPAEPPWYLRLEESTHVTAKLDFHHGNVIGGCECSNHAIQTRVSGSDWIDAGGDCLARDTRTCTLESLEPNSRIYTRVQTTCLDASMSSNWSDLVDIVTRPACTWTFDSSFLGGAADEFECVDKSFCNATEPTCCSSHGGILRCPPNSPVMCANQDCSGDYCCAATSDACSGYGGARFCSRALVPAEVPKFLDFNSYLASSLRITWNRGVYLSNDDSPCKFQSWYVEVAESYADGTTGDWVYMSNCATLSAEATSCEVGPEHGLISLQSYVARMKEICTDATLNSELSYTPSAATTWPIRAELPVNMTFADIRDDGFTVGWTPGQPYERHVQECDFHHWEIMIRLSSRYVQTNRPFGEIRWDAVPPERDDLYMEYEEGSKWYIGCTSDVRDNAFCVTQSLESDRDYNVKVRERCVDPNADSDYLADKLRTAAAPALAPENLTTSDLRKYRLDLLWDPGNRRACVFWAWQVMLKPFDAAWPEEDNETIAGGGHFFVYSRNITEAAFKLPLGSNSQYAARVRERCTDPAQDGEWGYLPSLWTAPPVQAERLENVTILFNWPKLLSVRFVAGPSGWLEDLAPDEPGYNSHSDCVYTGWYVEVADPSTPNDWVVQEECLAVSRDFEGCDISSGLEYGKDYYLRLREGCTDPSARSPEHVLLVTSRSLTPASAPVQLKANSDTSFSYEFSWEPGFSYDCTFQSWEVQLRSLNDTNSSAAALGIGTIDEIRSRIFGHSQNPDGQASLDWSLAVEACELPSNRELAWCRIEPLLPNAGIDIRVRELCTNSDLHSPFSVLQTMSPEAPATRPTLAQLTSAGDEGNTLVLQFGGGNLGDCLDALPQMDVAARGETEWTTVTDVTFQLSSSNYEAHDPVAGVIWAYGLQPDTLYFAHVGLVCPSGAHMNGPFLVADAPMATMPGCKWSRHSNRSQMLECQDGSFCNITQDEGCCSSSGGRQRCPPERPWMCSEANACVGGTDFCCETTCAQYGGNRNCTASSWPASPPELEVSSPRPATLAVSWQPRAYLSGASQCTFSRWDLQLAKVTATGLEPWVSLPNCYTNERTAQSCEVEELDFLEHYQVRAAELCNDSSLDSLYNWSEPVLVRGEIAGNPVNITMSVVSGISIMVSWDASTPGDCSFSSWEVNWRTGETWQPAELCQDLFLRNQTECMLELTTMESYEVQVLETCTDARTNSPASTSPVFRIRQVGEWEVYVGPSPSTSLAVSTLAKEVGECQVITTCCDDQFSICYHSTATNQLIATVTRTDSVSGWGQQLWLRCFATPVTTEKRAAAAPLSLELFDVARESMESRYSLGQEIGDCLCAHPNLQIRPLGGEWVTMSCEDMTLRVCTLQPLALDTTYEARVQVACENSSLNSPWTYSTEQLSTNPGCKWNSDSGNSTGFECKDGRICASEGCCGGDLQRCPADAPVMCSSSCSGDYCCAASAAACGTERPCSDSQVPAKQPSVLSVVPSRDGLALAWAPGSYGSGFAAPCGQAGSSDFLGWSVEVSPLEAEAWQSVSCDTPRLDGSCQIAGLEANTEYQVRLAELCFNRDLDSDYTVVVSRTLPIPADAPSELGIALSGDQLRVTWKANDLHQCVFRDWLLQWREWSAGEWMNASNCSEADTTTDPECFLDADFGATNARELRVKRLCEATEADSEFLYGAPIRWISPSLWEVWAGPSASSVAHVDVVLVPQAVEVALNSGTPTGQFSLCLNGHNVTITRADATDGWSEDLWIRCDLQPFADSATPPAAPLELTLAPSMEHTGAQIEAFFQASDLGGRCSCGSFELELQALNFSTAYGYSASGFVASECSAASLAQRSCLTSARPDARLAGRLRVHCAEASSDFTISSEVITPPACKWVTHAGTDEYECMDGSFCNISSCCNDHGGRARCPSGSPVMCDRDLDCADGQDHCCMETAEACGPHNGPRPCLYAEVPSKAPVITAVTSMAPNELTVSWQLASYLNGAGSRCSFRFWRLELSVEDGPWTMASECTSQDRRVTSCTVHSLETNSNYSLRLREACTNAHYDSDWALSVAATLPRPAAQPSPACGSAQKQNEAMRLQVSWTAGDPGDCVFEAWEVYMELLPSAGQWMLACVSQDTSCFVDGLLSGRYYGVRTRQVCSDPAASSDLAELTGEQCQVTAMAAEKPANLTASSLGAYAVEVEWAAQHPWACTFLSWQVQLKSQAEDNWDLAGLGCWSYEREVTNCTALVPGMSNTPFDVRVRETCQESSLHSEWLALAFPGVSTPMPQTAAAPTLQVTTASSFEVQLTWTTGDAGECVFSSWEVQLVDVDGLAEAISCAATGCLVSLRQLGLIETGDGSSAGSYHVRVRAACSDGNANSPWAQQDSAIVVSSGGAPVSGVTVQGVGKSWLLLNWAPGLSAEQCAAPSWRVWHRSGTDWIGADACTSLPCNVTGLLENSAYEVMVEEACESPWSLAAMDNVTWDFWTLPGEWSTFVGSSDVYRVSVQLTETPHRCYVQKECCADSFFLCHDSTDSRSVQVTRSDVPGGWGQHISLFCVTPALAGLSDRPQIQALGPETFVVAQRDNQSVTVMYPVKLAHTLQGCECAEILLEMAVQGSGDWLARTGVDQLCADWNTRECVVDRLAYGTTYEARLRITCNDAALNSNWTYPDTTVTTNLESFVITGALSTSSGRRLAAVDAATLAAVRQVLSQVTGVALRSVLVTGDLQYTVAAAAIGRGLDAEEAEAQGDAALQQLELSLGTQFPGLVSEQLGYTVLVEVTEPPELTRRSEAFAPCADPPPVANSATNWSEHSCFGRSWSDEPCAVPCDVGFLPEGDGHLCSLEGLWTNAPRCASIWTVGAWGACEGVPDNCGDGGVQRREVSCPQRGCHSSWKPKEEQPCRATRGCIWVASDWSSCSNLCGAGDRHRSVQCSSVRSEDCAGAAPLANESCSDFSNCSWQVQAWGSCSSTCGSGTQTREVACEAADASLCPSPSPSLLQYCYETASCSWQTSEWSSCSNLCGSGVSLRQVWCSSGRDSDCNSTRPEASAFCYSSVGCAWQKGPWSNCSSTCGPGLRLRSVACPSGQDSDCPGEKPSEEEACYATQSCYWLTQPWSECDNSCGAGKRSRLVTCSSGGPDADCSGTRPTGAELCYDTASCAWSVGAWSECSSDCGEGVKNRLVTCPSGWPADCASFQVAPAVVETCRGRSCVWSTGDWSQCSNDCGDGVEVRSVLCSSGFEEDCLELKPATERSCRVTLGCGWTISVWSACDASCGAGLQRRTALCDSGLAADCSSPPAATQSCYETTGCSWLTADWSDCSNSCGQGIRQRTVTCSSGADADCAGLDRPAGSEACYATGGCAWQSSEWQSCSESCGQGLRTRQVWCPSFVDTDCPGEVPARSDLCYNTSTCTWHAGAWSDCSSDCGDGLEARATTCSSGRPEDCSALEVPVDTRPCFSAASCAWRFDAWQPCNVSCGIGWQERTIWCPTGTDADCPHTRPNRLQRCHSQAGCQWLPSAWGACSGVCEPGTRSRNITCSSQEESDCAQVPRPADREACNTHAAGCAWDLGVWSPCSATSCGGLGSRVRSVGCRSQHGDAGCFGEKPREVEPCLSETTCVWQISEWDACDASCGWGVRSRLVQCSSPQEEECGEKPASTEACYSTAGCAWWTSQWSRCNATCGLGLQTRDLICGTDACDPSTAPSRFRNCSSIAECAWEVGEWGLCSTACGRGVLERPVACPSGFDADCAARGIPRPMDRRECTNTTGCDWSMSSWSVCSRSCGEGTQSRAVLCPSGEDGDCPSPKPSDLKSCAETVGCAWQIGEWSACSVACGQGLRTRTLSCEGPLESCGERPPEAENCTGLACGWRVGNWQSCNASCGHGLQMRSVECDEPGGCVGAGPATWQACVSRDACRWHSGQWSNCSEGCGLGTRSRQVLCSGGSVQLCSEWPRPADAESCSQENRSRLGPSCGWSVGAWSTTCGDKCGPHLREVFCAGHCFGRAPEGAKPCEVQECGGDSSARFDLSLRLENPSEQLLEELVAGTRQAVADLLKVTLAEVKVRVVSGTSRRLSVVMKLQVEVSAAASEIALLSSSAGQEMLHTELLESWDTRGLQDLSVVIGAVEDAEVTTSEQPEAAVRAESPTQAILLVVVCSFACSAVAGVLYCWRWRTSAVSPAAESPKGDAESPKGVALPSLRAAATASEGSMKSVVKEAPAMSVQVRVAASAEENSAPSTPAAPRKTTLPAKAVRTHSVRAVSVTRKSSQASASRSPLSHAPRPGSPSVFEMSPAPRLPLEPLGGGSDLTPCKRPPGSPSPKKT